MKMVWPGHHLDSRADAPGIQTQGVSEILPEVRVKEHEANAAEELKIHSKPPIRFKSSILLLIIKKASLGAFMQIATGHWLVHKDPYILVLGCYFPVPFCMFRF